MQTTKENKPEFTFKLQDPKKWHNGLREDDLTHNNISRVSSSPQLEELRERLRRKRYVDNAIEGVRAVVFPCCGLPDLRCSRYMRGSRRLGPLQRLPTHISRASSQQRLQYRNWTT
jgi:hypothetical protein